MTTYYANKRATVLKVPSTYTQEQMRNVAAAWRDACGGNLIVLSNEMELHGGGLTRFGAYESDGEPGLFVNRVTASAGEAEAVVYVYGEITPYPYEAGDISAIMFADAIAKLGDVQQITLRINSPGGAVHQAAAMYNTLKHHPARIVAYIDGIAGSAASYLAMVADEIHIAENAQYMIHNPSGVTIGEASEHRKTADILDQIRGQIADMYVARTGQELENVVAMMDAETWLTGEQAVAMKFADVLEPNKRLSNAFDLSKYRNKPEDWELGEVPDDEAGGENSQVNDAATPHRDAVGRRLRLTKSKTGR